jgi:hypothetical protein
VRRVGYVVESAIRCNSFKTHQLLRSEMRADLDHVRRIAVAALLQRVRMERTIRCDTLPPALPFTTLDCPV